MPNNYILLETIALTQSAASVTFDNLPTSGYTDLKVVLSTRTTDTTANDSTAIALQFNGDTASNYSRRSLVGDGASATSTNATTTSMRIGFTTTNGCTANTFGNGEFYVPNYRGSTQKSVSADAVAENNSTTYIYSALNAGIWTGTAAITSITVLTPSFSFVAGSTFSLYGIAAFGTTPVLAPKATGGNIVANDGTYWYHAFTSSGNFVPQVGLTADCLVVAGGGGAVGEAGGGGAGGLRSATQSLTTINYAVTVGAGGRGTTGTPTQGSSSSFNSLESAGGGAAFAGIAGGSGGSGAGGGTSGAATSGGAGNTPSTSPSQGNNGGNNGRVVFPYPGGGGGGAGAVGQTPTNQYIAGNGGAGVNTFSSWASVTSTGVSGFYAGGGGGGVYTNSGGPTAGSGGSGGGGAGGLQGATATSGTVNTGGGGGGSGQGGSGGAGGSGIVIIRYPIN